MSRLQLPLVCGIVGNFYLSVMGIAEFYSGQEQHLETRSRA